MKSSNYEYDITIGILAMEGRGFEYPTDSIVASNGHIYVGNKSRDYGERGVRISNLDYDSEYYGDFAHYGLNEGNLISPNGLAEDLDTRLFVSDDYTHQISSYSLDGDFIGRWGKHGNAPVELDYPSGIAFNSENHLYVSDSKNHRIQVFTAEGNFLRTFGNLGDKEGQFNLPWGIFINNNDELFVADWGNNRIQKFANDEYIESYYCKSDNSTHLKHPSSITQLTSGELIVADWGNEKVKILDKQDNLIKEFRGESGISKWANDFLETNVEENETRKISNLENLDAISELSDPHSISAHIEKYFWSPVSVTLDPENRIYVTESNRHRIQVYAPSE